MKNEIQLPMGRSSRLLLLLSTCWATIATGFFSGPSPRCSLPSRTLSMSCDVNERLSRRAAISFACIASLSLSATPLLAAPGLSFNEAVERIKTVQISCLQLKDDLESE
ncbi:unnamed protein product, partial [Chrysoparadoxa australica]